MAEQKEYREEKQKNSEDITPAEKDMLVGFFLICSIILFLIAVSQAISYNGLSNDYDQLKDSYDSSVWILSQATIWLDYDENIGVYYKEDFATGHMEFFHRHQSPIDNNYEWIRIHTDDSINYRPERKYHQTCTGDKCTQTLIDHTEFQNCSVIQDDELRWDAVCNFILYSK